MKILKKILFKILSQQIYLRLLHRSFYILYDMGILKRDSRYKYHYMVKKLIKSDYTVVDIGANLGYFSKNFARLTPNGKVICIEPVPVFFETLKKFLRKYHQVELFNVALGMEEGTITMVLPETDGVLRTGLPHIAVSEEEKENHRIQEVAIVKGSKLLFNLKRLDYIKCDIEGYELNVFNELRPIIEKHMPYVQIEISRKNLSSMLHFFNDLDYTQFGIKNFKFIREIGDQSEEGDFFFVPKIRLDQFEKEFDLKD